MAAANGVRRVWVGQDSLLSTPAVSAIIRERISGDATEESLGSVNLLLGGGADKQVRKYSRGMKRRLSVAISLIGDAKVMYMDEPSTGLDPDSRKSLWTVVKQAKQDRGIILTNVQLRNIL